MHITIEDSGLHAPGGAIEYLWFGVRCADGSRFVRAVALAELAAVPVSVREEFDLLSRQWAAVRGLYNAQADYIYTAAGIFTPQHVGVVQFYGGAGRGACRDEAAALAVRNLAAVRATLANYEQSRLAPPNPDWVAWYLDFITRRSPNIMALLGHPDPRATRRGLGKDGEIPSDTGDDLASEQNELLFRGLAKLREDFVFQVTSERISRLRLAEGLVRVAQLAANVASRQRGSLNIGFNLSLPLALALTSAVSGGRSHADSTATSAADGASHSWGSAHTDSTAHTESRSSTLGGSETHSVGYGTTTSSGHSDTRSETASQSHSDTWSHTDSASHSESSAETSSASTSIGHADNSGSSSNWSNTESASWSQGASESISHGETSSWSEGVTSGSAAGQSYHWSSGASDTASQSVTESTADSISGHIGGGVPGVVQAGVSGTHTEGGSLSSGSSSSASLSAGGGESHSISSGQSSTTGGATSSAAGSSISFSSGGSSSSTSGGGSFVSVTDSVTHTTGTATTRGSSDTTGTADSVGGADTRGTASSRGSADSTGQAASRSESWSTSRSWSTTHGSSDTRGQADSRSENWGRTHSQGATSGQSAARAASLGWGAGFSTGLLPGISIGRSWQSEDDLAIRLTELLRQFEGQLNTASAEGGFLTSAVLFTASEAGEAAARSLVPQAFHGSAVPTPVLTVQPRGEDASDLRDHALAFLHYPGVEDGDPLGGYLFTRYATLLTPGQNAAYTAPGLFEEGTAMTVMAPIPKGIAFYPNMPGSVLIGHQYSPETADLTSAPVLLDEPRMMHTLFAGDTGWGKSVAAIMMAYESTLRWKTRTVVLDFGAGWRQLLNAPGLEGHANILQLWPDAVRPFRWNPLQIGRQINPETQWRAFADIFGSIARLGVRRQKQELLQALREVYLAAGVLVDDPAVRSDAAWKAVGGDEEAHTAQAADGVLLCDLPRAARQALAVLRSSQVGLADLYAAVERKLRREVSPRDTMLQGVLEGILFRLNPLVQGAAASQFAPGQAAVPLEDLSRPWGVTVIEGGIFLDDFGKAFLLGWAGWHLYTDMVARRVNEVHNSEPLLQIYFEEANKVFGGAAEGGGEEEGGVTTSQRFADMFRDARKYKCRLHVVTQAPSLIPQDIISSCNNLVIGFLKQPKDKDIVLSALARSEKGFRDEEWRRFLTNANVGMAIGRFPYTTSRELQQPFLFQPLMLTVPEPGDADIAARLGAVGL